MFTRHLVTSLLALLVFTLITGILYPLIVTGIAQVAFPGKANGSLRWSEGKAVGSDLIGQPFSARKYFWSRLSATSPYPYNAGSSTGSNYGPSNPALVDEVQGRLADLKKADTLTALPVPVDLVTSSSSGLDPDISVASAMYQAPAVARSRGLREEDVRSLVEQSTEGRTFGILGEPRVNVLRLNLSLDALGSTKGEH
ncbi:MAG TPA: potassium-transporting ATPase subunit KdpC [Bacteroidota bacterium]|nr:potassium-transporting ATPase subunit KdpC [Bacteroidota bacterium]